jgi:cytochrome c-type biogenesis protein CcmE
VAAVRESVVTVAGVRSPVIEAGPEGAAEAVVYVHGNPGSRLDFRVADRDDSKASIPVRYRGEVPDPFTDGREVVVTGSVQNGTFLAQRDTLITKCPSKYTTQAQQDPQHVIITN